MNTIDGLTEQFHDRANSIEKRLKEVNTSRENGSKPTKDLIEQLEQVSIDLRDLSKTRDQAASSLPAHSQKTITETLRKLTQQHETLKSALQPRQKFSFKKKPAAPRSTTTTITPPPASGNSTQPSLLQETLNPLTESPATAPTPQAQTDPEPFFPPAPPNTIRRPSFTTQPLRITNHTHLHLTLPSHARTANQSLTLISLSKSIINLFPATQPPSSAPSVSPAPSSQNDPLSTLHAKHLTHSLLLLGHVNGPVHLTSLKRCTVVVSCRQFRMHESTDVDVYLWCGSEPIIEGCKGVRVGGLPGMFRVGSREDEGRWREVRDFDWVGVGASPNWRDLEEGEMVGEEVWRRVVDEEVERGEGLEMLGLIGGQRA